MLASVNSVKIIYVYLVQIADVCRIPIINNIIVSVSADRMEYMHHMLTQFDHHHVSVTEGSDTRHRSIYNAVKAIPHGVLITLIF